MSWQVFFSGPALDDLRQLDQKTRQRIGKAIRRFAETGLGDIKKLDGYQNEFRLRVGVWRVRFERNAAQKTVTVLRVRNRKDAYRD